MRQGDSVALLTNGTTASRTRTYATIDPTNSITYFRCALRAAFVSSTTVRLL